MPPPVVSAKRQSNWCLAGRQFGNIHWVFSRFSPRPD